MSASPLNSSFVKGSKQSFTGASLRVMVPRSGSQGVQQRMVTVCAAKVVGLVKLALTAGKANPAPPVGPALGSKGVNIMAFCKEYNARTADKAGMVIPVEITVFDDRTFTFILKTPPASTLALDKAKAKKGASNPKKEVVGKLTMEQITEIAKIKMPDLNCTSLASAQKQIMGTCKNMGIQIVDA